MTVAKTWSGTAPMSNPANWVPQLTGATGDEGPQGDIGPEGPAGPAGPPPTVTSLTRAAYDAIAVGDRVGIYIITDEGGSLLSGSGAPAGGAGFDGDFYIDTAASAYYGPKVGGDWPDPVSMIGPAAGLVTYSGTSVTAQMSDAGKYVRFTGTNPSFTIPPNSTVAFPVPTQIDGIGTATAMTLVAGGGVTINRARTLVTVGAKSGWTIIKVATDAWDLHGDFV